MLEFTDKSLCLTDDMSMKAILFIDNEMESHYLFMHLLQKQSSNNPNKKNPQHYDIIIITIDNEQYVHQFLWRHGPI